MKPGRTPNRAAAGSARIGLRRGSLGVWIGSSVVALSALSVVAVLYHARHSESDMTKRSGWIHKLAVLAGLPVTGAYAASQVPPTQIGINLSSPAYFRQARTFANLVLGASAWTSQVPGHERLGPDDIDRDGNLKRMPGGQSVFKMLTQPNTGTGDATIRCTYQGRGDIRPAMNVSDVRIENGGFTFRWRDNGYKASQIQLRLKSLDPADPIRNLDCRETSMPRDARFDPQFIAFVRQFRAVRFMDWQNTNANQPVTWAERHTRASQDIIGRDGVAVEDMVDLAAQAGVDPWFNMPWNADDDYIRRFAQYVHDHLPRDRKVYVEAGNEVWNARFLMSKQALKEGQEEGLGPNPEAGRLYRYAEKTVQVMDIWAKVFADRPSQLVRVANCQNGPNRSNLVLGYKDTAKHIDALATAPYFAYDFRKNPPADSDAAYARINDAIDATLNTALKAKGVAEKYGKRYIAYEAGQHIILNDVALAQTIQRDPRMYDAYKRYLNIWRQQIGDTIMMYDSVQPINKTGSWGLLEYLGQPVNEAPKMRAVSDALRETRR